MAPLLSIGVVVVILVVGAAVWTQARSEVGFRLRADTLVPTQLSVRPDDVECPDGNGASPIPVLETGALADALPIYDGDLIVVRLVVLPSQLGDEPIRFAATWPEAVVGDAPPVCVFVNGATPGAARIDWEPVDGGIEVAVTDAPENRTTEVEVWLVAADPDSGSTFRTTIVAEEQDDDVVIDPLGGRVAIDRRPGSVPLVSVVAAPLDTAGRAFEVEATISNATPRTRSLDVLLGLDTAGVPTWSVAESNGPEACTAGRTLECSVGDLAAGDTVTISATFQLDDDWSPAAVACDGPPADLGFGLCVEAVATSLSDRSAGQATASALVTLPQPPTSGLTIGTEPNPLVARAGLPAEFFFTLRTASDDLASIGVVGSDCAEIGREVNDPLEDGDAFLESEETWTYRCRVELVESTTVRVDMAAIDSRGQPISTSYETTIRVIDPQLGLVQSPGGDSVVVTNVGTGTIRDVALSVPACDALAVVDGQTSLLEEGGSVEFRCVSPADLVGAVAYGSDELGLGVVGTLGP